MAQDYYAKVLWREEDLADDALNVRRKHAYADNELSFNLMECLHRLDFTRRVPRKYFELASGEDPGYVTYDPLTLHLARTIRDKLLRGVLWPTRSLTCGYTPMASTAFLQ
jgi:hypothetical protein